MLYIHAKKDRADLFEDLKNMLTVKTRTMASSGIITLCFLLAFHNELLLLILTSESLPFGNFITANEIEIALSWEF
jgi:hypothetical protein